MKARDFYISRFQVDRSHNIVVRLGCLTLYQIENHRRSLESNSVILARSELPNLMTTQI